MKLYIAEKPSMAGEIAKGLGVTLNRKDGYIKADGDVVTWAYGHILQLYDPEEYQEKWKHWNQDDLPILPEQWKMKITNSCEKQFEIIKSLMEKADEIIHAGDPDREGQLLIDEILEFIGNEKPVKRLLLNSLDEKSVKKALQDLRNNQDFLGLKNSATGRQRADWLIGINLSRAFTIANRKCGNDELLSIGRVMTPTLSLVVRREKEIQSFKAEEYYTLKAFFKEDFAAYWVPRQDQKGIDEKGRLVDPAIGTFLIAKWLDGNKKASVTDYESKNVNVGQKLPYSLSSLQVDAGKQYNYDPQLVLDTAQKLYEKKMTTYPRSDCEYLPESQFEDTEDIIQQLKICGNTELSLFADQANQEIKSKCWSDKKITAHHALIPTTSIGHLDKLSEEEKNIFCLIAKAYLTQFYPVHVYSSSKVYLEYMEERFEATGKTILEWGWKELYRGTDEEKENLLPVFSKGDVTQYIKSEMEKKVTQPPTRFTASSLLEAMKKIYKYVKDDELRAVLKELSGIGTEATRAGIIDKLLKKEFLAKNKKSIVPTEKAYMLYEVLPEEISFPDTTAIWEKKLGEIAEGKILLEVFLKEQEKLIQLLIQKAAVSKFKVISGAGRMPCPECGQPLKRRMNKEKKTFFWACSGYPECKTTFSDVKGKPELPKHKCPECGKWLKKRSSKNGDFWGCTGYPDCKKSFSDNKGKPDLNKRK